MHFTTPAHPKGHKSIMPLAFAANFETLPCEQARFLIWGKGDNRRICMRGRIGAGRGRGRSILGIQAGIVIRSSKGCMWDNVNIGSSSRHDGKEDDA
jgi:hypothetical protein